VGRLDPTNSNATLSLLAASFGSPAWLLFSVIALALVSQTMRQLLTTGAESLRAMLPAKRGTPLPGTSPAPLIALGTVAILLAIPLRHMNLAFLVGWILNIAAATLFPAIAMPRLWKRTTQRGIAAGVVVGLVSTLGWILLSGGPFEFPVDQGAAAAKMSPLPFNQPAIITLPLACIALLIVSLLPQKAEPGIAPVITKK
jgi:cation/acetate symporter